MGMNSSFRAPLAVFLTTLMISHVAAAATSVWNGPSGLAGSSRNVADALIPGNATVIDAWLHVGESGYLEDGYGETWTGEDAPGNFTSGQFTNTMVGKPTEQCHFLLIVRCQISTHFLQPAYNCQALDSHWSNLGSVNP